jgi:hypothetical protein
VRPQPVANRNRFENYRSIPTPIDKLAAHGPQVPAYSDRKREREFDDEPLPIEVVTKIQQLACYGRTVDEIAHALAGHRIARDDIVKVLEPSESATPRQPYRPQRANVGYAHLKRGRPGYGR